MLARVAPFLALVLAPAAQTTWYVDDDGPCGAGTAVAPFCSVQEGIDAAVTGDLVLVLPGTYPEGIDFLGKDITVRGAGGPPVTVLDGSNLFGRAIVNFVSGEGPHAVVEGFTIRNGSGSYGGGIACRKNSSPTIRYNVLTGNLADSGAAIACLPGANARILSNVIVENQTDYSGGEGGAIFGLNCSLEIVGNVICDNVATGDPSAYGGGIYLVACLATIEHNLIASNSSLGGNGGGLYLAGTSADLDGNTIVLNIAGEPGGGIACLGSTVRISNTILWGNQSVQGDELLVASGVVSIVSSDVKGGPSGALVTSGALLWGDGNRSVDPLFVDPDAGDYHLQPDSPLVDAGSPSRPPGGIDADGDPRRLDGLGDGHARIDIGYDERNLTVLAATGSAALGGSLQLTTTTVLPHARYLLATSEAPGDRAFGPLGSLLLDLATLRVVALGVAPATDVLALPATPSLAGTALYAQSLAIAPPGSPGSFSNRLRFVLAPTPAAP